MQKTHLKIILIPNEKIHSKIIPNKMIHLKIILIPN